MERNYLQRTPYLDGRPREDRANIQGCTSSRPIDAHDHDPHNSSFDVQPDGQRFLVSRVLEGDAPQPVNICLNWLAPKK